MHNFKVGSRVKARVPNNLGKGKILSIDEGWADVEFEYRQVLQSYPLEGLVFANTPRLPKWKHILPMTIDELLKGASASANNVPATKS